MKKPTQAYIALGVTFGRRQDGQTAAEYGVVLGVIMIGLVATIGLLSDTIDAYFLSTAERIMDIVP